MFHFRNEWRLAPVFWGPCHTSTSRWSLHPSSWPTEKSLLRVFGQDHRKQDSFFLTAGDSESSSLFSSVMWTVGAMNKASSWQLAALNLPCFFSSYSRCSESWFVFFLTLSDYKISSFCQSHCHECLFFRIVSDSKMSIFYESCKPLLPWVLCFFITHFIHYCHECVSPSSHDSDWNKFLVFCRCHECCFFLTISDHKQIIHFKKSLKSTSVDT